MVAVAIPPPTAHSSLNAAVERVKEGSKKFAKLSIDQRIRLAEQMLEGYYRIAEQSVISACHAKGIDPSSPTSGEEWLGGPFSTIRGLRFVLEALHDIKKYGAPRIDPSWISTLPDGRLCVRVFPTAAIEGALLGKHVGDAHMMKGVTRENLKEHQATFYRRPHEGRLCLVLGAGNVNSIPSLDCITKMFNEGTACVLKMNPVNAYVGPFIEQAFKAAIDAGYLSVVYGGGEEGSFLANHPLVDEIHITGSDKTVDNMVWGPPGPEREARKARNEPLLKKPVSAELGNVTPAIVIPGPWREAELNYTADSLAGQVMNNASFNCNAVKLVVTQKSWDGRQGFLDKFEASLGKAPTRRAYYPGAEQRWKAFTDGRKDVRLIGKPGPGELSCALIRDIDASNTADRYFKEESWCTVVGETAIEGANTTEYLRNAVKFVNDKVWGTLAAVLVVHPETLRDPSFTGAFEEAIGELRYGAVCVNTWAGVVFGLATTPWGGHPSTDLRDVQSGTGWAHNTLMLENVEKVVVRGPHNHLHRFPWAAGHRTLDVLARRLTDFEYSPSWLKVPGIAAAGLRG